MQILPHYPLGVTTTLKTETLTLIFFYVTVTLILMVDSNRSCLIAFPTNERYSTVDLSNVKLSGLISLIIYAFMKSQYPQIFFTITHFSIFYQYCCEHNFYHFAWTKTSEISQLLKSFNYIFLYIVTSQISEKQYY